MKYVCNGHTYEASSLEEAYLMALKEDGASAIGANVKGENGDFLCGVCLEAYRRAFGDKFTDEDFLEYEIAYNHAWAYGEQYTYESLDEDYEPCTCTRLSDEAMAEIEATKLAQYMDEINFMW